MRTEAQNAEVIRMYLDGATCQQVADKFGVKQCSMWEFLKRRNLTRPSTVANRRYSLNQHAFDEITEASSYWVGFLITDGCLTLNDGTYTLLIQVAEKDAGHVERFKTFLGAGHPIKIARPVAYEKSYNSGNYARLHIRIGRAMAERLIALGVTPRKSMTAEAPAALVNNRHFWRGVIDGDGTVLFNEGLAILNLYSGSMNLLNQYRAFVQSHLPECGTNINRSKTIFAFRLASRAAERMIRILYSDCTIALARKEAVAKSIYETAHVSVQSPSSTPA